MEAFQSEAGGGRKPVDRQPREYGSLRNISIGRTSRGPWQGPFPQRAIAEVEVRGEIVGMRGYRGLAARELVEALVGQNVRVRIGEMGNSKAMHTTPRREENDAAAVFAIP